MSHKFKCPCCGSYSLEHKEPLYYEICPICYWENDPIQNEDYDFSGGANEISLNKAIKNYKTFGASHEKFIDLLAKDNIK